MYYCALGPDGVLKRHKVYTSSGRMSLRPVHGCCSAMCYVMRGVLNRSPLVGCPALPFIDQGGAGITDGRKKKNQRQRRSFEGARSSFSFEPTLLTWQTVLGIARSVILIGPCSGFVQQVVTSHPAPVGGATHQGAESRPYGEHTA